MNKSLFLMLSFEFYFYESYNFTEYKTWNIIITSTQQKTTTNNYLSSLAEISPRIHKNWSRQSCVIVAHKNDE